MIFFGFSGGKKTSLDSRPLKLKQSFAALCMAWGWYPKQKQLKCVTNMLENQVWS